jgi:multidrug efflux system outer membrane protein
MRHAILLAGSLTFLVTASASAQTAPPTPPPATAPAPRGGNSPAAASPARAAPPPNAPGGAPGQGAGSSSGPNTGQAATPLPSGAAGATSSAGMPVPLVTNDPMLEPIAPAPNIVPSWQEALAMLRARSTDFRIAMDEIERSEGQWRIALAQSLPTLYGNASVTGNMLRGEACAPGQPCRPFLDAVTVGASATLTQPILATRAWHAPGTAKLARKAAELSAEDQKRVLSFALANAVVRVVTAERLSEINRIGLRAALERLTLAKRRVALGAGNALDTVRADQDVSVTRATVVTGDETLRQAREALGLALGSTEAWGVRSDVDLSNVESTARSTCTILDRVEDRADIASAQTRTQVAQRNIDDVWLQFAPTVNLVSTVRAASTSVENLDHVSWTIAGVLTVPFFDGGARYGALRDTRAQADETEQILEASRRTATVEVIQAKRSVEVAEESRRVAEQARDLARETERLSRVSFAAGTGTSLDLIESGRRLRESESQLALQEFTLVQARIAALLSLSRCNW